MIEHSSPPTENRFLAALPREDYERISQRLTPLTLERGQVIYHTDELIEHVYFPISAMISMVSRMSDGSNVEVGVVGREGVVGLPALLGVARSPHEYMTQIAGSALRANVGVMRDEFKRGGKFQDLLHRYAQSLLLLTAQAAACNGAHTIGERLARWLLMSYDRCLSVDLPLTHEFLAMMLGVRRAGVTEAAIILQAEGLIEYRRGHINIIDKPGLEEFACECYGIIKAEFDNLI
jgi:CRP-like cAMP-binding protein